MGKRKRRPVLWWLVIWFAAVLTMAGSAYADVSGGVGHTEKTGTDIYAGVVVDYMGKLRFLVLERGTTTPIPGASIEIYVPGLDRYILVGTTDQEGKLDLDVVYDMNEGTITEEDIWGLGGIESRFLYLRNNTFDYRAYKAEWLPYPHQGTVVLEAKEIPQVEIIYLHKKGKDGNPDPDPKPKPGNPGSNTPGPGTSWESFQDLIYSILDEWVPLSNMTSDGIPKTGVRGAAPYWIAGMVLFFSAGVLIRNNTRDQQSEEKEEGDRE